MGTRPAVRRAGPVVEQLGELCGRVCRCGTTVPLRAAASRRTRRLGSFTPGPAKHGDDGMPRVRAERVSFDTTLLILVLPCATRVAGAPRARAAILRDRRGSTNNACVRVFYALAVLATSRCCSSHCSILSESLRNAVRPSHGFGPKLETELGGLPGTISGYCAISSEGDCTAGSSGLRPESAFASWDTLKAACQRTCEWCPDARPSRSRCAGRTAHGTTHVNSQN